MGSDYSHTRVIIGHRGSTWAWLGTGKPFFARVDHVVSTHSDRLDVVLSGSGNCMIWPYTKCRELLSRSERQERSQEDTWASVVRQGGITRGRGSSSYYGGVESCRPFLCTGAAEFSSSLSGFVRGVNFADQQMTACRSLL